MPARFRPNARLGAQMANHFGDLIAQGGHVMVRETKRRTPVGETGNLRNGMHVDVERHGTSIHVEVGDTVNYGVYVEFGTSKMRGRHMLANGATAAARWLAKRGFKIDYTANK